MKYSNIGGQAVMEGIMMKNGEHYAVAVRKPDKEIEVKVEECHSFIKNKKILQLPFIRGVFNFVDSLVLGMKSLMFSAEFFMDDEEEEKERKKEVQELEQEKEHLTAEKEELTAQIAESRADIQNLKDDKEQAIKAKQEAEQKAGSAEKELKSLEDRREQLQPIMDSVSKEIKEYGTVKMLLPEAGTLERAVTYRDKKIKPLFLQIKNKVAVMAAQVKELTKEVEGWKRKYQKVKQKYNAIQRELDDIRKDNQKLSEEKDILQGVSDRYDRVVRVLGIETVDTAVQQDIQNEKVLEEKRRMEQMPKGNIHERLAWGMKKSEMENQQRKKTKSKNREMER